MARYPSASCAVVIQDKKILAISRRNSTDDFNLPGGKVDEGETPEEACVRELKEETGLGIVGGPFLLYRGPCRGDTTYDTYCFLVTTTGEAQALEPGFTLAWVSPEELCAEGNSFYDYNRIVVSSLRQLALV